MANIPVYIEINGDRRLQSAHPRPATGFYFSGAWEWPEGTGTIVVNMEKAREIQRESIRAERKERWPAADAAWYKAQESANLEARTAAVAHKQALRDAPADARIDTATVPGNLKN